MATAAKITSVVPYFGGKRTMADSIVEEFGKHLAFWDCPCGSLAVTFAKPPSAHETAVDLHADIANLVMVLASDQATQLYDRLVRTICAESIFESAQADFVGRNITPPPSPSDVSLDHVARAAAYFIVSWMGRNGVAGTERINYQMAVRWTPGGGHGGVRFTNAVESIPWWHQRLRRVLFIHRDLFEVLEKIDDVEGTVIYSDPPYLMETRGGGGGSRYEHDFSECAGELFGGSDDDHQKLQSYLARFKHARVVVSYYDHPRIRELYKGWTIREMSRQKNLHVQNRRGAGECVAPEILLINGPSLAAVRP